MAQMTITSFMTGIKNWVLGKIGAITDLIPTEASSSNKLADKAFVNSSIATATATFRGTYNVVSDLSLSYNATHAQIQTALGSAISTADNNDYAFVQIPTADATPTQIAKIERYKYSGSAWAFEYELNNSGFTAAQWAAINSGITGTLVTKLGALPTNAELTTLLNGKAEKSEMSVTNGTGADADKTTIQLKSGTSATVLKSHIPQDNAPTENSNNNVKSGGIFSWVSGLISTLRSLLLDGDLVPAMAETLAPWADQKAIATPDTYTDAVRTTGGDIPIETSAGSKPESIKPVAGSKWTAKMLFNGSYNMLNAAKWGAANSQPYVGGIGSNFVYFLVPELTLGTFGTADENNGLLFTDSDGENVQPTSVYFKPLGSTVPSSLTDGTSVTPTSVNYDGSTYKTYETSGAGWLIIPKTYYDNDVCAHIAWEDWYDKYVSLDEPTTNPEAVVGTLMLEGLLALAHSDKYLRGVNDEVCDKVVFGDTSATVTHMVDELSVAANSWTNAATGESDSQGNALYRHSATVSGIKQGGAACVEGEDGGIPLTVNGTTVSYVDTNATAPASTVFYEVTATSTTKAYTDTVFSGSNINTETGILPINDCSIEAQVAMVGKANITVKYAKNIVDQVAINATVDVPQIKEQVEEHEERITELEDTAVRTGSYDASVAVGLADNFKGDTIVDAEFYKRKTGGTQSVGSGIAAIKEVRGKSIVWNQWIKNGDFATSNNYWRSINNSPITIDVNTHIMSFTATQQNGRADYDHGSTNNHKFYRCVVLKTTAAAGKIQVSNYGGVPKAYNVLSSNWQAIKTVDVFSYARLSISDTRESDWDEVQIKYVMFIDLTLMFGAGNEPATVAEFEKMFPLDYYDYNEGEVIPFAAQNLVTTGFNQWDEQWEEGYIDPATGEKKPYSTTIRSKNFIKVTPGSTYYAYCGSGAELSINYFDSEFNILSNGYNNVINNTFVVPDGMYYIKLYPTGNSNYGNVYKNDICVNISNTDRNGTYEPYEKHTLPLDPSQWRDKQGNLVFPYGGMHGVGTAYDYAKVDADGYIRKVVRVIYRTNLGNCLWYSGGDRGYYTPSLQHRRGLLVLCPKYVVKYAADDSSIKSGPDKTMYVKDNMNIFVKDSSYSTVNDFKAAMNGVMLYYSIQSPVEVELATPIYAKYLVDKDGTEEITPANGTTPYTTMANLSILYAMDARGEIKNLPKNYLSKESAENMLNAMVSAGVIASYTMTWDAANSRYAFVITAPVEPEPTPEPEENNE